MNSEKWPKRCVDVTWEMQDAAYGESAADARIGDLVWHPKGVLGGHVLVREYPLEIGWTKVDFLQCECGEAIPGDDHHIVMLARKPDVARNDRAPNEPS